MTSDVARIHGSIAQLLEARSPVDWDDAPEPLALAEAIFDEVTARPGLLISLVEALSGRDGAAESFPSMDKLVLWQSPDAEVRLRLHVFFPGYADRRHNHRWSFVSRILSGGYVHSLYGSEADVQQDVTEGREPRVVYSGHVHQGSTYFLHHSLVHSLRTDELAVSLLLRGPSAKDDYFTVAAEPGAGVEWSTGAARESSDERARKAMPEDGLARVLQVLEQLPGS